MSFSGFYVYLPNLAWTYNLKKGNSKFSRQLQCYVEVPMFAQVDQACCFNLVVSPSARNQPKTTHNDDKIQVKDIEVFHDFYFILETFRAQT